MRIKFRAWDIRKNVMREVVVLHFNEASNISGASYWSEDMELKSLHGNYIKLMQYIGLKDSNGVEIYEGDVIEDEHGRYNLVRFSKGLYFIGNWNAHGFINAFQTYKVIGNIYENSELLEGE